MTWPSWATLSASKFMDWDVHIDPTCERVVRSPVNWRAVANRITGCAVFLDHLDAHRYAPGDGHVWGMPRPTAARSCATAFGDAEWASADRAIEVDVRYSSFRNDCYFGSLATTLCEHMCGMTVDTGAGWGARWHKLQLEMEAIMFFLEVPWSSIVRSRFRIPALLARLSRAVKVEAGPGALSTCDANDGVADRRLFKHVDPVSGLIPANIAEFYIADNGNIDAWAEPGNRGRCPLGLVAAVLSLAILMQGGLVYFEGQKGSSSNPWAGMDPWTLIDIYMIPLMKTWEEQSNHFFFDIFTSHWRIWDLLHGLDQDTEPAERRPPTPPLATATAAAEPLPPLPQPPAPAPSPRLLSAAPAVAARLCCRGGSRARTAYREERLRVVFLGGERTTFKWTSFTQRGRQLARGLRSLGADSRAWNAGCDLWCRSQRFKGAWRPSVIIHVKFVCRCALANWRRSVHVFDPVDIIDWRDKLGAGRWLLKIDAILVTTSLALEDLRSHPAVLAAGNVSIHWLPLHHSNFRGVLSRDPQEGVRTVGVHTVHHDLGLHRLLRRALQQQQAGEARPARFMHLDPNLIFRSTEGRIVTPQQTNALYLQLGELDVAALKQSGCRSEWYFCSRWRTGQRLTNHLSVGIPTIVWGDAQGHLDVVRERWPRERSGGRTAGRRRRAPCYPRELIVADDSEAPGALAALLGNTSLRLEARACGLKLAKRFSLERLSAHLLALLRQLLCRRASLEVRPWRRCGPL